MAIDEPVLDDAALAEAATVAPARPDITPAQIVSGIPILAELAHTFGVFDLSQAQQDSLEKTVLWAIALVGADTLLRIGRNLARRVS